MDFGLNAKVALITGAGRGIGKAEALTLVAEGAMVAINDINAEQAQETAEQINAIGGAKAKAFAADVSDENAVKSVVERVCAEFGAIDILVNNAGAGARYWGLPVDELPVESWDMIINTHLRSTFLCSKYVARIMKRQRFGRIVNTSSMNAIGGGPPGASNYTAAKAAIIGLTRNMAKEIGSFGVTVNAIAPGYVHTDLVASYPEHRKKIMSSQNPVGRLCDLNEVAALVAFLCSKQAAFINGAVFSMDGGRQDFVWGTQLF
jgi:3-oxoacyl-[acyl-carrier protein] reductase